MTERTRHTNKREQGVALMLSILLLIAVSGLALSTMRTAASDGTVAGFQNQEQIAFYAAEAGIAFEVATYPFDDHGKSMVAGALDGFVKLIALKNSVAGNVTQSGLPSNTV